MAGSPQRDRFEALYRDHARAVLAYALRRTSRADAQDVAADTFLVAWRRIDDVPRDALPWLLGTARKLLANERRATHRRAALSERIAREAAAIAVAVDAPPILEALARLDEADREVLCLRAWDGLDAVAAGRVLGCTPLAYRLRLHRARRRLRTELAALAGADPAWLDEAEPA
jgi:RNA polymerase sigma-70 factor (ECF subfamily)